MTTFEEIDELDSQIVLADAGGLDDYRGLARSHPSGCPPKDARPRTEGNDTSRNLGAEETAEPELSAYGNTLARVLKSTFGRDKAIAATIYQEPDAACLPVRMVTIHLDWVGRAPLTIEPIEADRLLDELASFHREVLGKKVRSATGDGLGFQRVAFFFHTHRAEHGRVRNLTIIKPDEYRYWTRSQAMRDADELAAAIMQAAGRKGSGR